MATGISWTDDTWNPIKGCSRVSPGCANCYAEVQAARIVRMGKGKPTAYDGLVRVTAGGEPRWTGRIRLVPEALALPLSWRKPRRIFVDSMSDLFHERLDDEQIDLVFAAMLLAPRHTFQVLTKRAARMRSYFEAPDLYERVLAAADYFRRRDPRLNQVGIGDPATSPARWIWLGISVENQDAADERIPELLRTPAAVRFLSCEPLLGEVDLAKASPNARSLVEDLDWIIAGCESGPGARPCSVEWLRSLRDQCAWSGVAFFLKQAVEPTPVDQPAAVLRGIRHFAPTASSPDGSKRKPGGVIELPYLDGVQHAAFPEIRS